MDIKKFWKEKQWKKWRKDQWLIVFLAGILLLVIAIPTGSGRQKEKAQTETKAESGQTQQDGQDTRTDYETMLEQRLENVLSRVDGVGKVQVMITLKDNGEAVVEKDVQSLENSTSESDDAGGSRQISEIQVEESTIYQNQTDEGEPFVSKENKPRIEGVLVVAQGGGDAATAKNISESVLALFDVEAHKIKVVKMNMQEGSQ